MLNQFQGLPVILGLEVVKYDKRKELKVYHKLKLSQNKVKSTKCHTPKNSPTVEKSLVRYL